MCIFAKQKIDIVNNPKLQFYKLIKDNSCEFDEYCKEVEQNAQDKKALIKIYAFMDMLNCHNLTISQFRKIKGADNLFEFKNKNLRVYVLKVEPNVCIVCGGTKNSQPRDIDRLKRFVKTIPPIESLKSLE